MDDKDRLRKMLTPHSIAVIGASREPVKIGHATLLNVLVSGYPGKVYPVNPNAHEIMGLRCYPSVLAIPDEVDVAIITVPAKFVPKVVRECAEKGVAGTIIISAGFGEIGGEGKVLEDELRKIVKETGIRIIGPNTMGYKNPVDDLDASFVFGMPDAGDIALASQSGALCIGMIHHANRERIGLSKVISVGNKIDVDDGEIIDYLNGDPDTKVIAMYIEGIKDGKGFIDSVKKCKKPIVAIKSGRTKAGAAAAATHTGSLSGSDRIYDSVFKQLSIHRARDTPELFDFAIALSRQPALRGRKIGIVTNGGGAGILLSDAIEMEGLEVGEITEETKERLRKVLPPISTPRNPVDVIGDAGFYLYESASKILLEDKNIDGIIVVCVHAGYARPKEYVGALKKLVKEHKGCGKPILGCWIGGEEMESVILDLKKENIPIYPSTTRAARAMAVLKAEWERTHGTSD